TSSSATRSWTRSGISRSSVVPCWAGWRRRRPDTRCTPRWPGSSSRLPRPGASCPDPGWRPPPPPCPPSRCVLPKPDRAPALLVGGHHRDLDLHLGQGVLGVVRANDHPALHLARVGPRLQRHPHRGGGTGLHDLLREERGGAAAGRGHVLDHEVLAAVVADA